MKSQDLNFKRQAEGARRNEVQSSKLKGERKRSGDEIMGEGWKEAQSSKLKAQSKYCSKLKAESSKEPKRRDKRDRRERRE